MKKISMRGPNSILALVFILFSIATAGNNSLLWAEDAPAIATSTAVSPDASAPAQMPEIVVSARRTTQDASKVVDNISIITARDLAIMPVSDLAEALNFVTGADIQSNGSAGQPSTISIQGCNPAHVRIMVDGVLLNQQVTAWADPSQIPIGNVERIEIIKGTASSAWGSSLGGVINVITKSPRSNKTFQGDLTLATGSGAYGFNKQALSLTGQVGNFGYLIWGDTYNSDSEYRSNSEVDSQKASGKISYFLSDRSSLEASFNYSGSRIGGSEFDAAYYGVPYQEALLYASRYGSLKYTTTLDNGMEINATAKISNQDNRLNDFEVPTAVLLANSNSKNIFSGLDLQSKYQINKISDVLAGIDVGQDKLDYARHEYGYGDTIVPKESVKRQGYYANFSTVLQVPQGGMDVTAGGRYDNNEAFGSQFSPSAGAVYHYPLWTTDIRLSLAKAFNAPKLIYRYDLVNPNTNLKAERAPIVYEFGIDTRPLDDLMIKFSLYRVEVKDLVDYDPINMIMNNIKKARRQGVETEAHYNIIEGLKASASCALNRVQDRDTGDLVTNNGAARLTYNAGLNYNANKLNLNLQGNYRFWDYDPWMPKDRRFIWDVKANYDFADKDEKKSMTWNPPLLFVAVYNIFDTEYWYQSVFPMPGRRIEAGIKYSF